MSICSPASRMRTRTLYLYLVFVLYFNLKYFKFSAEYRVQILYKICFSSLTPHPQRSPCFMVTVVVLYLPAPPFHHIHHLRIRSSRLRYSYGSLCLKRQYLIHLDIRKANAWNGLIAEQRAV